MRVWQARNHDATITQHHRGAPYMLDVKADDGLVQVTARTKKQAELAASAWFDGQKLEWREAA